MTMVAPWGVCSHGGFFLVLLYVLNLSTFVDSKCHDFDDSKCHTWAGEGACHSNVDFMSEHCRKSCGLCKEEAKRGEEYDSVAQVIDDVRLDSSASGDEAHTTRSASSDGNSSLDQQEQEGEESQCRDLHDACPDMAQKNECMLHAHFMLRTCPETCNVCHLTIDELTSLLDSSNLGVPQLMGPNESKKIGQVLRDAEEAFSTLVKRLGSLDTVHEQFGHCRNRDVNCAYWAAKGYCHKTNYMEENCGPVCRVCY